jgi:hypothetical protein
MDKMDTLLVAVAEECGLILKEQVQVKVAQAAEVMVDLQRPMQMLLEEVVLQTLAAVAVAVADQHKTKLVVWEDLELF